MDVRAVPTSDARLLARANAIAGDDAWCRAWHLSNPDPNHDSNPDPNLNPRPDPFYPQYESKPYPEKLSPSLSASAITCTTTPWR